MVLVTYIIGEWDGVPWDIKPLIYKSILLLIIMFK